MIDARIIKLVNNVDSMIGLSLYIDQRVEELKDRMVTADINTVIQLQAQIQELRNLKKIRDIVIAKMENG